MSEGQTKRRIGQGMKPRGEQAEPKPAAPVADSEVAEVPTTEGQAESIIEPILARQEGEQSGDSLEPETVQTLDSEETAGVAQSEGLAVEDLLLQSAPETEYTIGVDTSSGVDRTEAVVLTPTEMDATAEKVANKFLRELTLEWASPSGANARVAYDLGLQPDGSHKIVTTIPEGYWQAVKDWAESDGVTPEEWVDRQLSQYLESWGSPAKGR